MRKFQQNKLWRDKAPALMEQMGSIIHCKNLSDTEYDEQLRVKLIEEAHEVNNIQSKEELLEEIADIFEVVDALLTLHKIKKTDVGVIQKQKRIKRGSFTKRMFVTIAEHPIDSFGEKYCLADPKKYPEVTE